MCALPSFQPSPSRTTVAESPNRPELSLPCHLVSWLSTPTTTTAPPCSYVCGCSTANPLFCRPLSNRASHCRRSSTKPNGPIPTKLAARTASSAAASLAASAAVHRCTSSNASLITVLLAHCLDTGGPAVIVEPGPLGQHPHGV